jgi:hypothetical protein
MPKMSNDELISIVLPLEKSAVQYAGEFNAESEKAYEYYFGLPFGDEQEGRSQLISTDVQDVIESDMPGLVRTFLGSNNILKFIPRSKNPKEVEEAKQKTDYLNWLIRHQEDSFSTLHGWMKNALIQKISVVKTYIDEFKETTEHRFENITDEELLEIQESLQSPSVTDIEMVEIEQEDNEQTFNITFKVTREESRFRMVNIAPENFRVSRYASNYLNDAELVGDEEVLTRGDLKSMGYPVKLINQIPMIGSKVLNNTSNLTQIRFHDEDSDLPIDSGWASEEVAIQNLYVKIDFDGDGIAERRYIRKGGNVLLENEPFEIVPYAPLSSILMPNKLIGRSRAELVMQTQLAKSVMLRGAADNTYSVNNPRIAINDDVYQDDAETNVFNGIIRVNGKANPGQSIYPVMVPAIADQSLMMLNYLDQQRANRTGALATSQSLNADDLNQETATRFNGIEATGKEKTELIARVFAETGFRKLFEDALWWVTHYQNTDIETMITGKELKVNPGKWKYKASVVSEVGLAVSDNEDSISSLTGILQDQMQLKQLSPMLIDDKKIYNVREKLIKATGLGSAMDFYNNPEEPEELLKAQNEQLNQMVIQMQQQLQQLQNPLAEAEQIKQQAFLLKAQSDAQLKAAQLEEDQRQFQAKLMADFKKSQEDMALKLTEMELKYNKDLNKQLRDNEQI